MPDDELSPFTAREVEKLDAALAFMRQKFAARVTLRDVAKAAGVSPYHFHRRFSKWHGKTPKRVLTELQIEKAQRMLLERRHSLEEVARASGFSHASAMAQRFRLVLGVTPTQWRREQERAGPAAPSAESTPL
jgi:transcriptional regulator GlxA family with amidase domain